MEKMKSIPLCKSGYSFYERDCVVEVEFSCKHPQFPNYLVPWVPWRDLRISRCLLCARNYPMRGKLWQSCKSLRFQWRNPWGPNDDVLKHVNNWYAKIITSVNLLWRKGRCEESWSMARMHSFKARRLLLISAPSNLQQNKQSWILLLLLCLFIDVCTIGATFAACQVDEWKLSVDSAALLFSQNQLENCVWARGSGIGCGAAGASSV